MIFLSYDNVKNIIRCNDINDSKVNRFRKSPTFGCLERYSNSKKQFNNFSINELVISTLACKEEYPWYIVATGVAHAPWDWCGCNDLEVKYPTIHERNTVFYYLSDEVLTDMRNGKAFLLLDQSHEGYHTEWLFDWFYSCFKQYNIPPKQLIYVTGNLSVEEQYKQWCHANSPVEKMCVIPNIHFEEFICTNAIQQESILPTVTDHLLHKKENRETIKTYNCFQKRARPHRIWMFNELYKNNLLDDGINSMNYFDLCNSYYEGKWLKQEEYDQYINMLPMYPRPELTKHLKKEFEGPMGRSFEKDLYHIETRNTWVSVVSEASFAEKTCFISEKTFKPIAARHPFILYGNKNSLKYLRDLGYKTFNGFINESYDELDTWERLEAIIQEIKRIKSMSFEQKINWYDSMRDILDYNYDILKCNSLEKLPESILKIRNHVKEAACTNI